jgi:hypothetical protein
MALDLIGVAFLAYLLRSLRAPIGRHARMRTAIDGIDQGPTFSEGHELDEATAALVPATAIGRHARPGRGRQADSRMSRGT